MSEEKKAKYIEGVGWLYDTDHTLLRRMYAHDYQSRSIYMITLTLADRSQPLLGNLKWEGDKALLIPTLLGKSVIDEWHGLCRCYSQLEIIRIQLMPEHLHVVLFVKERIPKPLGKLIGVVKNYSNKHYWKQLTEQGMLGPKGEQSPPSLFSENYQDMVLSRYGQLNAMINYVENNPFRALVKRRYPDMFKVVKSLEFKGMEFAAIGNRWLMQRPLRFQVRCHNNNTEMNLQLIAKQKEYFLKCGAHGAVIVSPCISAGEKEIARAALDEGLPLIVILENGFPPLYKPPGKYFEACAKGLLLMLAPWPYHTERRVITRQQCLALNDMAKNISTEPWTKEMEKSLL